VMEYVNVSPVSTSVVLNVPTSVPCAAFSATVAALRLMSDGGVPNGPLAVEPRFPTASSPTQKALLPVTSAAATDTANDPAEPTLVDWPVDLTVEAATTAPVVSTMQYTVLASSVAPVMDAEEPLWVPPTPLTVGAVASGGTHQMAR